MSSVTSAIAGSFVSLYEKPRFSRRSDTGSRTVPGGGASIREGSIVKGRVVRLTDDQVIVDIGHKSEGEIPIQEFQTPEGLRVKVGDDVEVYLDTFEDGPGGWRFVERRFTVGRTGDLSHHLAPGVIP